MMVANLTPGFSSLSLEAQLDIVKNASVYEKRMEAIKEAEASAKAEREKLTKAKNLDSALKQAKELEESARTSLNQAKAEAIATVNHANERSNQIVREAEARAKQTVESANRSITEVLDQIIQKQAELGNLNNQVGLLNQQIEALGEKYNQLVTDIRAKEMEKSQLLGVISEKQRKLKELLNA